MNKKKGQGISILASVAHRASTFTYADPLQESAFSAAEGWADSVAEPDAIPRAAEGSAGLVAEPGETLAAVDGTEPMTPGRSCPSARMADSVRCCGSPCTPGSRTRPC